MYTRERWQMRCSTSPFEYVIVSTPGVRIDVTSVWPFAEIRPVAFGTPSTWKVCPARGPVNTVPVFVPGTFSLVNVSSATVEVNEALLWLEPADGRNPTVGG